MVDEEFYRLLTAEARGLLEGERDRIANAANLSALLYGRVPEINWVGFYFLRGGELVVGPFCGKPACTRIAVGRGVCGTAIARRETLRVDDVHDFDGHIACDADSRSELVVPLLVDGEPLGVLDIDSPVRARFSAHDARAFERLAAVYLESIR